MTYIFSLLIGAATGAVAVLLHNALPPAGPILAFLGTFISVWSVGRKFGKRIYKIIAALSWLYVFSKASLLGAGGELLVQGDNAGSALLFFGVTSLVIAVALPA
jgi:xanthosine utilization system XapX-like protein